MAVSLDGESISLPDLQQLLGKANQNISWTPPPRFIDKRFANFRIDPQVPGQAEAVAEVQNFVQRRPGRGLGRLFRRRREPQGCYLDGDFGVGKTHLLAAAWHAAPGSKNYISFAEAMNLLIRLGTGSAIASLAADLVCIDEFELDDPSNTRFADLLCHGLVERNCRLLVTSNTVPGELGVGRLFVDQFRAQLVRISNTFVDIHVPGHDYRQLARPQGQESPRRWSPSMSLPPGPRRLIIDAADLDRLLQEVPVVHLRGLGQMVDFLGINGLNTFPDQLTALRFVHLIDRVYDQRIAVAARAHCALDELFHPDYRDWAFAKKYRRCLSRLSEAASENRQDNEEPHALSH